MTRRLQPLQRQLLRGVAGLLSVWLQHLQRWQMWAEQRSREALSGDPGRSGAGGPPAHWLDLVSQRAPWLLERPPRQAGAPRQSRCGQCQRPTEWQVPGERPAPAIPEVSGPGAPARVPLAVRAPAPTQGRQRHSASAPVGDPGHACAAWPGAAGQHEPAPARQQPRPAPLAASAADGDVAPTASAPRSAVTPTAALTTRAVPCSPSAALQHPARMPAAARAVPRVTRPGAVGVPRPERRPAVAAAAPALDSHRECASAGPPGSVPAAPAVPRAAAAVPRPLVPAASSASGPAAAPLPQGGAADRGQWTGAAATAGPERGPWLAPGFDRLPLAACWPALPDETATAVADAGTWPDLPPPALVRTGAGESRRQAHRRRLSREQEGLPWNG